MSDAAWHEIRQRVYDRAGGCCEYCRTCEVNTGQTMQVDHIDPQGGDDPANLCLACWNCNNHKRQATSAPDPATGEEALLFNPRVEEWTEHFEWVDGGVRVRGLTATGRATVERFKMKRPAIVIARARWVAAGYHPPG